MTTDIPHEAPDAARGLITYLVDIEGVSIDNAISLVDTLLTSYIEDLQGKALRGELDEAMKRVRALQERYQS